MWKLYFKINSFYKFNSSNNFKANCIHRAILSPNINYTSDAGIQCTFLVWVTYFIGRVTRHTKHTHTHVDFYLMIHASWPPRSGVGAGLKPQAQNCIWSPTWSMEPSTQLPLPTHVQDWTGTGQLRLQTQFWSWMAISTFWLQKKQFS